MFSLLFYFIIKIFIKININYLKNLLELNGTNLSNGVPVTTKFNVTAPIVAPFDRILNYEFCYVIIPNSPFY